MTGYGLGSRITRTSGSSLGTNGLALTAGTRMFRMAVTVKHLPTYKNIKRSSASAVGRGCEEQRACRTRYKHESISDNGSDLCYDRKVKAPAIASTIRGHGHHSREVMT